jgi:universal stress protein A
VEDFRRILCPVDFSPNSLAALETAKEVALKYQARVYPLHVARIPAPDMDMDTPIAIPPRPHWEKSAYDRLRTIARQKLGGVTYEVVVKEGIPESGILEAVNELGIDLVVMSSHGRSGLAHFVLGSVAEEVVRTALCPVLVVKPHQ